MKMCSIVFLTLLCQKAFTQSPEQGAVLVIGQVLEEDDLTGLPFAHIQVENKATTTDFKGIFKIRINADDTIRISYVGYKTEELTVPEYLPNNFFETKIILRKDTILLKDANITILPSSIEAFKQAVLSLELNDQEYQNVQKNMEVMARQLSIYNYDKYAMDAGENYRAAMHGPQGFNIKAVLNKVKNALAPPKQQDRSTSPVPVYYEDVNPVDSLPRSDTIQNPLKDTTFIIDNQE